ncbi:hypothetical protein CFP56_041154 [Quercus suber]|uniref:Uncharacterized protein n=1 Tax=Quercus suber TaxID=58331 RepID=A0AAW0IWF1_QUESU
MAKLLFPFIFKAREKFEVNESAVTCDCKKRVIDGSVFGGGAGFGGWVVILGFLLLILLRWVVVGVGEGIFVKVLNGSIVVTGRFTVKMSLAKPLKKLAACVILDLDGTLLNTGINFIKL